MLLIRRYSTPFLIKRVIEGKDFEGMMEVTVKRGRRRKQMDVIKAKR
jgi:hypothetical protein